MKQKNTIKNNAFKSYKKEVLTSINKTLKRIDSDKKKEQIKFNSYFLQELTRDIIGSIKNIKGINSDFIEKITLEEPPSHIGGDLTFNTFRLEKQSRKEIIKKIINKIEKNDYIEKVNSVGPYINIHLNGKKFYNSVLKQVKSLKDNYGESDINAKKIALFDYSSPNVAKPIGVGHLRSTIIGQSLTNIYQKTGYSVIRDNHLGDWGTQFGELIYAYDNWGNKEKVNKNPIEELKKLYIKFHKEVTKKPEIKNKARNLFKELEQKKPKLVSLWKNFRDLSIIEFKKIYNKINVEFDTYIGESYFTDKTENVLKECFKHKVCKAENANLVLVENLKGLPSFLLRKEDGSSLYLTRDLATLKFRIKTFKPNVIVYVVGKEQELNFKQLFALGKELNYLSKTQTKHISFGLILSGGKKMSTRKGTVIELDELMKKSINKSEQLIKQKNPNLDKKERAKIAEITGIGAILYNDLRQSRTKDISFDWNKMLNFEGGSSIYLQYTYVRINSIIKKIASKYKNKIKKLDGNNFVFKKSTELSLAKKMSFFPMVIINAQESDSPHLIANYLEELAQMFNNFYNSTSIINTKDLELFNSRIVLIKSVAQTIKNGLELLNIKVPDKM